MEQYENNRIYRPRARYIGRMDARYVPIEQR
jgi:citrate synthase